VQRNFLFPEQVAQSLFPAPPEQAAQAVLPLGELLLQPEHGPD
jgi:hypothetical protein